MQVQRFVNKEKNEESYFDLREEFQEEYISDRLMELCGYYSNRISYKEVEKLVTKVTGVKLLSDQKIQEIVSDKSVKISKEKERKIKLIKEEKGLEIPAINVAVDIYNPCKKEILLFADGIQVKKQKEERENRNSVIKEEKAIVSEIAGESRGNNKDRINTDVIMLEKQTGKFEYIMGVTDENGNNLVSLADMVKSKLITEYGDAKKPLDIVAITDGAKDIRLTLLSIFGITITIILDWYHLCKKIRELMSMIARNKEEKIKHVKFLIYLLWRGMNEEALTYLKTKVIARNQQKYLELIKYIEKHKVEIIDYMTRKEAGKTIGSGRMEKGVDQVVGFRQKKKGMSWSQKGSRSLAILKIAELNNVWEKVWFKQYADNYLEYRNSSFSLAA